jgi:hypothetical protein
MDIPALYKSKSKILWGVTDLSFPKRIPWAYIYSLIPLAI